MRDFRFLMVVLVSVVAATVASAYPIPRGERAVHPGPATSTAFAVDDTSVTLLVDGQRSGHLYPKDLSDAPPSLIRARMTAPSFDDVTLVFRTTGALPSALDDALGVRVSGDEVRVVRLQGSTTRDTDIRAHIRGVSRRVDLEIVIFVLAQNVSVLVFDGGTKDLLGSLDGSLADVGDPHIGLVVGRRQRPQTTLRVTTPASPASTIAPRDPEAREWTVRVARGTALPTDVARMFRRVDRDDVVDTYVTRELGLFILEERGIPLVSKSAGVGAKHRDATFASRHRRPIVATKKSVTDIDGLKDASLIERLLRAFASRFPTETRLLDVGKSHEGRPLLALVVSSDPDDGARPALLLMGGHHGDEVSTPEPPLDAIRYLLEHRNDRDVRAWLDQFTIVAMPLVNPDGNHAYWHVRDDLGRTNAYRDDEAVAHGLSFSGVDLNRNYPFAFANVDDRFNSNSPRSRFYRGPAPGSEPETKAVMALAARFRFVSAVTYHASATTILVPYTVDGAIDPSPKLAWSVAEEMLRTLPEAMPRRRYRLIKNLYPVGGTDQDWLMHTYGTLAYLVELPVRAPSSASLRPMVERSRPIWTFLLDRYANGPSLEVQLPPGTSAEVRIDEIEWKNGERFFVSPTTGRAFTYLPAPGTYHVRVIRHDGVTSVHPVIVDDRPALVTVGSFSGSEMNEPMGAQ